jgi:hypothetical protein
MFVCWTCGMSDGRRRRISILFVSGSDPAVALVWMCCAGAVNSLKIDSNS